VCKVTYFVQQCPTCGRRLQVKVEYMGMEVVCQHCGGLLRAQDPSLVTAQATSPEDDALDRADRFQASSPLEFGIDTLTEPI
jgi:DNA-directed RNA polymerase subunit RPC12/RpoP